MIDTIIAVALNLMNPQHLRNWESSLLLLYLITAKNAVFLVWNGTAIAVLVT
jgi:hypothetical protein